MNLGQKLFIGFISATLFGIILFGYITYQTTRSAQLDELTSSLDTYASQLTAMLAGQDIDTIRMLLGQLDTPQTTSSVEILVVDNQQEVHFQILQDTTDPADLGQLLHADSTNGHLEYGTDHVLWTKKTIKRSPFHLYLLLHTNRNGFLYFLKTAGVPIVIGGLILLWLAFWAASSLSSLYKRLDQQRAELEYQAMHDDLTGLPNRHFLVEQTESRLQRQLPDGQYIAMVIIDINRLKDVNDTLGHYAGDALLCQIATRLNSIIRDDDILSRIVSDEFALLLDGISSETILAVTSRIQETLGRAYELEGHELYLGSSIGVAFYPEHAQDAINLIRHGEMAMYAAKHIGTGIAIYDETHQTSTLEQLKLINDLRTDLENRNIRLYFQPKVDLSNGQAVSLEALARWEHPDHGYIATSRFIHIAENTGLINPLTFWVLENAMQRACQLQEQGLYLNMAINLSVWNLQDNELVDHLHGLLQQYNIDAARVTLEITETAMMVNHKRALHTLHRLHQLGVNLSIDDFGTGYSSMAYLKRLPLNEVKIDKSFIKSMDKQADDTSMVRAIIDLAHDLGLRVVGEGVENAQIAQQLHNLGCDLAQGSYYADAMPFEELAEWLARFNNRSQTAT